MKFVLGLFIGIAFSQYFIKPIWPVEKVYYRELAEQPSQFYIHIGCSQPEDQFKFSGWIRGWWGTVSDNKDPGKFCYTEKHSSYKCEQLHP